MEVGMFGAYFILHKKTFKDIGLNGNNCGRESSLMFPPSNLQIIVCRTAYCTIVLLLFASCLAVDIRKFKKLTPVNA